MIKIETKKIIIMSLALIALTCSIAALSAADNTTTNNTSNDTVIIDGLQFKIPEGFNATESDPDLSKPDNTEHMDGNSIDSEISTGYINTNGEKLEIHVGSKRDSKIETINVPNAQKKTIAGKDGYFWTEIDDNKTEYKFEFLNDGKIVKIESNNEYIINQALS